VTSVPELTRLLAAIHTWRDGHGQPGFSVIGSATRTAGGRNRPFALAEERSQLTAVPGGARRPGRSVQETAP
jgi:hypothetical protein